MRINGKLFVDKCKWEIVTALSDDDVTVIILKDGSDILGMCVVRSADVQ